MPTAAIYTLGCRANQYDSESILVPFLQNGYKRGPEFSRADVHIVNTCTVTNRGESKSRRLIRRLIKMGSGKVIVTGCSAQLEAKAILALGADLVVDNVHKHELYRLFKNLKSVPRANLVCGDIKSAGKLYQTPIYRFGEKARAHIKIQDGCNHRCTYCIIPTVRGKSRSLSPRAVLSQAQTLIDNGYREIVLTGIHLGQYRSAPIKFPHILKEILQVPGKFRLRLSAIEPREITSGLTALFAQYPEKLCRHLHIAIQSASDTVLQRMNRRYKRNFLENLFNDLFRLAPDLGIGIDIISGFPGESDREFEETHSFIQQFPLSYGHVFRFSPKQGTPAASFTDKVPEKVKNQRSQILRSALAEKQIAFIQAQANSIQQCVFENETEGHTGNFTRIRIIKGRARPGSLKNVRLLNSYSQKAKEKFPFQEAEILECT